MPITRLHLIPDANNITESLKLSERFDASFEYNDFFIPDLLDDKEALKARIDMYKSLDRDRTKDTLHGVFFDICVNSSDSKIRKISCERMESGLMIASELDCKGVIFHTNTIPGFETPFYLNGWLSAHEEFYTKMCEKYSNLNIYVENMFDYKPDMLLRLAQKLENVSNFGVCYDVSHSHVHDISMNEWMVKLAKYIKHLHINDNYGKNDEHNALGDGTIDWDEYFKLINELLINASMLVEVKSFEAQRSSFDYLIEKGYING